MNTKIKINFDYVYILNKLIHQIFNTYSVCSKFIHENFNAKRKINFDYVYIVFTIFKRTRGTATPNGEHILKSKYK